MDLSYPDDSYPGSDVSYPTLWTIRTQQIMTQDVIYQTQGRVFHQVVISFVFSSWIINEFEKFKTSRNIYFIYPSNRKNANF